MDFFKNLFEKYKKTGKKNLMLNLLAIVLIGVLLIIVSSFFKSSETISTISADDTKLKSTDAAYTSEEDYEEKLQFKLKNIISQINGVGRVDLIIYFDSSEEQVPAVNMNNSTSQTEEKDPTGGVRDIDQNNNDSSIVVTNDINGSSKPLIIKTYKPKITGVCIVAEGAENKITELRISKVVTDLFNLQREKVNVMPMKK